MQRNTKLFYLIAEAVEEHPEMHDQSSWFGIGAHGGYDLHDMFVAGRQVTCGTTQCIAGWAIALERFVLGVDTSNVEPEVDERVGEFVAIDGLDPDLQTEVVLVPGRAYEFVAARLLGLSPEDADRLFYEVDPFESIDWPAALRDIGDGSDVEEALLRHGGTTPELAFGCEPLESD
jgi:hypothetical protein